MNSHESMKDIPKPAMIKAKINALENRKKILKKEIQKIDDELYGLNNPQ
jgi:hypothetical protein